MRFRADVEGLRGVAVLLVVLDHLKSPGFRAGFWGRRVLRHLRLPDHEPAGGRVREEGRGARRPWIDLDSRLLRATGPQDPARRPDSDPRRRRCRRCPAHELRVAQLRHDALWATFFGSNVNFIRQATDYFAQGSVDSSPFQHYWSLAVEEQFYVVWPALFLIVARLTVFGAAARWRARVATAVCAIGAASLVWSIVATGREPAAAYFSTFTRAWELALGALLGIATTAATRLPRSVARAASAAGVVLFVAACAVIGASTPFPGAAALLPTFGTALLIVGGLSDRARSRTGRCASHPAFRRSVCVLCTGRWSSSQPPCTPQ